MDNCRYGLTSALELLVGPASRPILFFFSNSFYIGEINLSCLYHAYTCQTDIISESFKENFTLFLYSS